MLGHFEGRLWFTHDASMRRAREAVEVHAADVAKPSELTPRDVVVDGVQPELYA